MTKQFLVNHRQQDVLNWSFGIGVAILLLGFIDSFVNTSDRVYGLFVDAISPIDMSNMVAVVKEVVMCVCTLSMWEVLRRSLYRRSHFALQLSLVVMMVLVLLGVVIATIPSGDVLTDTGVVRHTSFGTFKSTFPFFNHIAIYLAGVFVGVGLIRNYLGNLRFYGWALITFPVLDNLFQFGYYYLYTQVGGLTVNDLSTWNSVLQVAQFGLTLGSFCLLRFTMSSDASETNGDDSDINPYQ